ncbi:hypothetical protein Vadar_003838 [Vaccinium darrowii]|uniref:Uncharacterized protein n=1 Tax=Vaccinium darrowii TaxID=229202 RepID=A0ACB7YUV5_9ERIC|nr:hypothetical protein Vadar_003838 [Vaccinium darrowii]
MGQTVGDCEISQRLQKGLGQEEQRATRNRTHHRVGSASLSIGEEEDGVEENLEIDQSSSAPAPIGGIRIKNSIKAVPHERGKGKKCFKWRKRGSDPWEADKEPPQCSSIFVEPMKWMESVQEGGVEEKIQCMGCKARLGSFNWAEALELNLSDRRLIHCYLTNQGPQHELLSLHSPLSFFILYLSMYYLLLLQVPAVSRYGSSYTLFPKTSLGLLKSSPTVAKFNVSHFSNSPNLSPKYAV